MMKTSTCFCFVNKRKFSWEQGLGFFGCWPKLILKWSCEKSNTSNFFDSSRKIGVFDFSGWEFSLAVAVCCWSVLFLQSGNAPEECSGILNGSHWLEVWSGDELFSSDDLAVNGPFGLVGIDTRPLSQTVTWQPLLPSLEVKTVFDDLEG